VLVPGLGSGARLFGTLPRRFQRAGFTCAAVDPVGLPPSSALAGPWSFAEAGEDLLAVARSLLAPVSLVGTSLGGKVALAAAAAASDGIHRLVMLCSSAVPSHRARRIHRWFGLIAEHAPEHLGELTAPFLFGATFHEQKAALVDDIVRATEVSQQTLLLMRAQVAALLAFDGTSLLRACTVKTLCLAGAEDVLTPPDEVAATARLLPDATFAVVPAAGHSLLLESAEAFERVVRFLGAPAG
jgi:3-oxoadipate enol-lactonase